MGSSSSLTLVESVTETYWLAGSLVSMCMYFLTVPRNPEELNSTSSASVSPGFSSVFGCFTVVHPHEVLILSIINRSVPPLVSLIRARSEEHTSELQSQSNLVCRLLLE